MKALVFHRRGHLEVNDVDDPKIDVIERGNVGLQKMFETKVRYRISEQMNGEAEAVVVICPFVSRSNVRFGASA
jgi:hypothetical protein